MEKKPFCFTYQEYDETNVFQKPEQLIDFLKNQYESPGQVDGTVKAYYEDNSIQYIDIYEFSEKVQISEEEIKNAYYEHVESAKQFVEKMGNIKVSGYCFGMVSQTSFREGYINQHGLKWK
jgi:hypothetical protein